jgi:hypothetical protein
MPMRNGSVLIGQLRAADLRSLCPAHSATLRVKAQHAQCDQHHDPHVSEYYDKPAEVRLAFNSR